MTALEIIVEIKVALKQFGEYSYFDEGPGETMNIDLIYDRMRSMTAQEIADVLVEVKNSAKLPRDVGETFVSFMLCYLDDQPDMDALYADKRLEGLY